MGTLFSYKLNECISKSPVSSLYRASDIATGGGVLLQILNIERSDTSDLVLFKNELEIIRGIESDGTLKISDVFYETGKAVVVFEDFNGSTLTEIIAGGNVDVAAVLSAALQIADVVSEFHAKGIIHGNIRPSSILFDRKSGKIRIAGCGLFGKITREIEDIYNPDVVISLLPYISPEQTGRMNKKTDLSSDFYSLGITMYEMLAGKPPFFSADPLEIIHSHIARKPASLADIAPGTPRVLSEIITKLLSKNPEERYQTWTGFKKDIRLCENMFKTGGEIELFTIGKDDVSDRFVIPEKIYGRAEEIRALLDEFGLVSSGGRGIMIVSGGAGTGKTVLINEIYKPVTEYKGYFISGKFDLFIRHIPYYGITQAFQQLVRSILIESEEKLERWKSSIRKALGNNGKIITDVIPELELLVGKQPDIQEVGPEESQNRFNMVFQNFVELLADENHPLILFLDDLQWADLASLNLLKALINTPSIRYLLIIIAYREDEKEKYDQFSLWVNELNSAGAGISRISLKPLDPDAVNQLICETLNCSPAGAEELTSMIYKKTEGNPFFVRHFLKMLYDDRMIYFEDKGWRWNSEKIGGLQVIENVADLMINKITRLSGPSREVLKIASVIGNIFDIELLNALNGKSIEETLEDLKRPVMEGFLLPYDNKYRFAHDRIYEAVNSLLSEEEKTALNYRIGRYMLNKAKQVAMPEMVFSIVDHLNVSVKLIKNIDERIELVFLNVLAGKRAKTSNAYIAAVHYQNTAISLLPELMWGEHYRLTLAAFTELAECEYLAGNFEKASNLFLFILGNVKNNLDRAGIYMLQIILYTNQGRYSEVVEIGIKALRMFGIKLPADPGKAHIILQLVKTKKLLRGKKIEDLKNLPPVADPEKIAIVSLMSNLFQPLYFSNEKKHKNLLVFLIMKVLCYSINNGSNKFLSYVYVTYGMIIGAKLGDYKNGFKFGKQGIALNDKYNNIDIKVKAYLIFGGFINHWRRPAGTSIGYLQTAVQAGLEAGDFTFTANAITQIFYHSIRMGMNLGDVLKLYESYAVTLGRTKYTEAINTVTSFYRMVLLYSGLTVNNKSYSDDKFDEDDFLNRIKDTKRVLFNYYLTKIQSLYLLGYYREAVTCAFKMHDEADDMLLGVISIAEYVFYFSLALTACYADADKKEKKKYLKILYKNSERMKKWAENCPENFLHQSYLISAGIAGIEGKTVMAIRLYDFAVKTAHENGYTSHEGIANELAAEFYLRNKSITAADAYLAEAYGCFRIWGGSAKVEQLENKYASLALLKNRPVTGETAYSYGISEKIDLATIMKASHAISSEIVLDKLLDSLMKMLLEITGATRGFLIMEKEGELYVQAEGFSEREKITELKSVPLNVYENLSPSIVNYVRRTLKEVILNDAQNEGLFRDDPFIRRLKSYSVLCVPLMRHDSLKGIAYFENSLTADAFLPERLDMVRILSTQAAISLENAMLYDGTVSAEKKMQRQYEEIQAQYEEMESQYEEIQAQYEEIDLAREEYRVLFENIQDMFYRTDRKGCLILVSPSCLDLLGYTPAEITGRNFTDIYVHSEKRKDFLKIIKDKGFVKDFEVELKRKDGSSIIVSANSHYYRGKGGDILGVEGMIRDITDRKKAEGMLLDEKERLAVTLRSIGDGVITTGTDGRVALVNKVAENLTGWTQEEASGRSLNEIFNITDEKTGEKLSDTTEKALSGLASEFSGSAVLLSRGGAEIIIDRSTAPISDKESRVIGSIIVFRDVTDKRIIEKELLKNQKMDSLGIFAGGIAHDFNNILTGIIGNISLAKIFIRPDEKACAKLNEAEKASLRARDLTQQLLTFAKGGAPIKKTSSTSELLRESVGFVLSGSNVKCRFDIDDNIWNIDADAGQINQVINNLIINSIQAMPEGGTIHISASNVDVGRKEGLPLSMGRYVKITIRDEGAGIPEENLTKIFDPFFTTKTSGSGLGLSTTYSIIRKHDGHIAVESRVGIGTAFHIYLPASGKMEEKPDDDNRTPAFHGHGRILLMDDEEMILEIGMEILMHLGFDVTPSRNGVEAIEIFRESGKNGVPFDAVIMDLTIPGGMGGKEAVNILKEIDPGIKVVVSSGYSNDPIMSDYRKFGFAGMIIKPYRVDDMRIAMEKIFS